MQGLCGRWARRVRGEIEENITGTGVNGYFLVKHIFNLNVIYFLDSISNTPLGLRRISSSYIRLSLSQKQVSKRCESFKIKKGENA